MNVADLNKVLKTEVFMSEDKQLRDVNLILDFKPLFDKFQDVGYAIRASDARLARIDVSVPGFLARENVMQVELPSRRYPCKVSILREETTFSYLSLEAKIEAGKAYDPGLGLGRQARQVFGRSCSRAHSCAYRPQFRGRRGRNVSKQEERSTRALRKQD